MTSTKVCKINGQYYLYERESYWDTVEKKTKQRHSTYVGKCDRDGKLISAKKSKFEFIHSAFPVGPLSIFYSSACELQLVKHIMETIEVSSDIASQILCLALNQIVSKRSIEKLPNWILRSPIMNWESLESKDITRRTFETCLSNLCIIYPDGIVEDNGLALQNRMTNVWNGYFHEPPQYYYDITKQSYSGTNSFYAEPGFKPGGTNKYVMGFGLVTSRKNHLPVVCRPIRGSKNDTITVQDTINTLKAWGLDNLLLIMDRGMVSDKNVRFLMKSEFNQIGIVPDTNKSVWSYLTQWSSEEMLKPEHVITRSGNGAVYARSFIAPLFGREQMNLVVVEDPERRVEERLGRDQVLRELSGQPSKKRLKELKDELKKQIKTVSGRRGFIVDQELVTENQKGDGRFLLFSTNLSLTAEEIFRLYFQRDEIEKAFSTMKGKLKLGPIRYQRIDRINAYSTIVYLAYLLWSWTEQKLKRKYPDMSLSQALDIVEDVSWVSVNMGKTTRDWTTRLTKEQGDILKHLGAIQYLHVS